MSDLSISDDEERKKTARRRPVHEILTTQIDGDDFNTCGEVRTKTYKIDSPARVICHSPSSRRDGSVRKHQERSKITPQHQDEGQEEREEKKSSKSLSFEQQDGGASKKKPSAAKKNKSTDNTKGKTLKNHFVLI